MWEKLPIFPTKSRFFLTTTLSGDWVQWMVIIGKERVQFANVILLFNKDIFRFPCGPHDWSTSSLAICSTGTTGNRYNIQ